MYKRQGFDALPDVVDSVDDKIAEGWLEVYRGVAEDWHADEFIRGDYFPGTGIHGNGTYTAVFNSYTNLNFGGVRLNDPKRAFMDAVGVAETYAGPDGVVMRMAINPNARLARYIDIYPQWRADNNRVEQQYINPDGSFDVVRFQKEQPIISDLGRWLVARGYDGMYMDQKDFLIIYNRGVAMVERAYRRMRK